jgi:hypothetical protein
MHQARLGGRQQEERGDGTASSLSHALVLNQTPFSWCDKFVGMEGAKVDVEEQESQNQRK